MRKILLVPQNVPPDVHVPSEHVILQRSNIRWARTCSRSRRMPPENTSTPPRMCRWARQTKTTLGGSNPSWGTPQDTPTYSRLSLIFDSMVHGCVRTAVSIGMVDEQSSAASDCASLESLAAFAASPVTLEELERRTAKHELIAKVRWATLAYCRTSHRDVKLRAEAGSFDPCPVLFAPLHQSADPCVELPAFPLPSG